MNPVTNYSVMDASLRSDIGAVTFTSRQKSAMIRRHALHCKYEKAVTLYANTGMALKAIARECNVSEGGLSNYLRRYWRELVLQRHRMPVGDKHLKDVKIVETGKQNIVAHEKYKDAIAACNSLDYIDFNISQLARKFGVDSTALPNFMRIHYPDTLAWRENVRRKLGINDNIRRGARPQCIRQYAEAVKLYKETDMTVAEIATQCNVSEGGLSQHLRFYHKDILTQKRQQRKTAKDKIQKTQGELSGNGHKHEPLSETDMKYSEALSMYKDTALTLKEIAAKTGVSESGFRSYLHKWHKELVLDRLGIDGDISDDTDLRSVRLRIKTVAAKYEKAIESLRLNPRPVTGVARDFGLHPEVFRNYLYKHEPELVKRRMRTK